MPDSERHFWSFEPLHRVPPPAVHDANWCRTPLDHFILARLEAANLRPNPPVNRRQLIRRVYFDVIGLPPSPDEVEAFVNDPSPDAYDKLVDRLLASPHHGERWGRYWLDLARFAESHGFEHDYDRPSAYPYRDFVIRALNDDLPYDTFVKWQLAGDELAPNDERALAATGFLAAGVHSTQITANEVEKHRYDELDDMLATTGTSLLGLTLGCARCHDHKYDPILQRDYYQMLATFTTTVRSEIEREVDPAAYRVAREAFDREHETYLAALRRFEQEQIPGRLADWSKKVHQDQAPWVILEPTTSRSAGGATFTPLDDGSLLVGGTNPATETFTFVAATDLAGITAIRLEALSDPSLVKGGPGRAPNGNFALTELQVTAAARDGKGQTVPVVLRKARATFEQKGLPVAAAIDRKLNSAWAVDPQFGKDHAAVFETEQPVGFPGGTVLTFTLHFRNNTQHAIGRPRLSVTTAPGPVGLQADGLPSSVRSVLRTPPDRWTAADTAALVRWYRRLDPDWRKLDHAAREHQKKAPRPHMERVLISTEGLPAVRLHTQGADFLPQTHFLRRGNPEQKEAVATQGFLQVLTFSPEGAGHWRQAPPAGWRTSYRRRALAEWLCDVDQGAGRLLARVIVNRLWQHHLGRGLVATPSDFGTRGERPTHPELLDYLAAELIRNGWHLKPIHRLILTSATYFQDSSRDESKLRVDPDNRLWWRRLPHRLEGEVIRDALLTVAGELDERPFGPGTLDEASKRRSIYFTVKRSKLIPMLHVFDAPDALGGIGERPTTTIAPQALLLMNNPHVRGYAHRFAQRLVADSGTRLEDAVALGYRIALARSPSPEELADALAFVKQQRISHRNSGHANEHELALADFCQVLFCLNEFVYVD